MFAVPVGIGRKPLRAIAGIGGMEISGVIRRIKSAAAAAHIVLALALGAVCVSAKAAPASEMPRKNADRDAYRNGLDWDGLSSNGLYGVVSEVRFGYLGHDLGVFGSKKENGQDGNFEVAFVSPDFLRFIGSPRPFVGASLNNNNETNIYYGGLGWTFQLWRGLFLNVSEGLAGITRSPDPGRPDRKELGSKELFRESVEIGWAYKHDRISLMLDHISHGTMFGHKNQGLDTGGIRYAYRF